MKKGLFPAPVTRYILFLTLFAGSILCPGCASTYIKVLHRKGPTVPFTNVFAFYISDACNFSFADSTGYNICLKSGFDDSKTVEERSRVERLAAECLGTPGTKIYSASELMGVNADGSIPDNSYDQFRRLVDSLHIDGILVIQMHHLQKDYYRAPLASAPVGASGLSVSIETTREMDNAEFDCYLIEPKNLNSAVWTASLATKGASPHHLLDKKMTRVLAKSLIDDGYIVH